MKKTYYNQEVSQDKSAMVLERCNTMDIKDGVKEEECLARTASASSLDRLSDAPATSRVKSREISKSLSEDSLIKRQSNKAKAFTEDDLSSSWLYKTMQASINARFKSPRKSPSHLTTGYLEPIAIKDPKFKPIPVKSRATRTSSCLCHFATLVAVSLCIVGFLASIAAIIYVEVFAGRNLTSLHTSDAQIDLSDVVLNSLEASKLTTHGLYSDEHEIKAKSTDETSIKDESISHENIPRPSAERTIGAEKPADLMKLNQYINTTETTIKFQDKDTIILEIKSSDSNDKRNFNDNISVRKQNLNENKRTNFKDQSSKSTVENELKEDEPSLGSQFNAVKDSFTTESKKVSDSNLQFSRNELKDFIEPENELKNEEVHEVNVKTDLEMLDPLKKETFEKATDIIKQLGKNGLFNTNEDPEKIFNPEMNDLIQVDRKESSNQVKDDSVRIKTVSNLSDLSEAKNMQHFLENQYLEENSLPIQNIHNLVKSDHDVDSMVMMVDEPEKDSTDSSISNNEENLPLKFSSIQPSFVQAESESNVLSKRPVDIKTSLAEAMKHLQILDTQNKLLTSRTKTKTPKGKNSKKQNAVSRKNGDSTLEKQRYLQKVRFMLYNQFQ